MPVAMALLRDVQNLCPKEVLNFILDLIKYNDNGKNKVRRRASPQTNRVSLLLVLDLLAFVLVERLISCIQTPRPPPDLPVFR